MALFGKKKKNHEHKCLIEFPFVKVGRETYSPRIEVTLCSNDGEKERDIICMLDSGADITILPMEIGRLIDVNFSELSPPKIPLSGMFGSADLSKCREGPLTIKFMGNRFCTKVIWVDDDIQPVIGRSGFFDNYDVYFKKSANKVTLVFHQTPACYMTSTG